MKIKTEHILAALERAAVSANVDTFKVGYDHAAVRARLRSLELCIQQIKSGGRVIELED